MRATTIALIVCLGGCADEDNPSRLIDTTANAVKWSCSERLGCSATASENTYLPTCPDERSPGYGTSWGRFFSLWTSCSSNGWHNGAERLVACNGDDDCPNLYMYEDVARYECVRGLCQNEDVEEYARTAPLWWFEVSMLCLADVPRSETESALDPWAEAITSLTSASCESIDDCTVPSECRQP
jgi:hypothetical protein